MASQHPGSVLEPVRRWRRKPRPHWAVVGYRVGFAQRLGAPFRTPVMTWELEETVVRFRQAQARRWLKRGGLRGGVSSATRVARRRWRRAGRAICRLAQQGDLERAEALDPQPRRLGVMWEIW